MHKGVLVHAAGAVDFAGTGRPGAPYVLDMTPGSSMRDFTDGVLGLGKTFQALSNGVSITVDALETDGATVTIKFPDGGSGAPTCIDGSGAGTGAMNPPPMQGMCDSGARLAAARLRTIGLRWRLLAIRVRDCVAAEQQQQGESAARNRTTPHRSPAFCLHGTMLS